MRDAGEINWLISSGEVLERCHAIAWQTLCHNVRLGERHQAISLFEFCPGGTFVDCLEGAVAAAGEERSMMTCVCPW